MTADPEQERDAEGDLEDAAIDWLVHLESGRAGAADRDAFAAWRRRSAAHEAAARDAERLWRDIGRTASAAQASGARPIRRPVRSAGRRAFLGAALAACVGAVAVATGLLGPLHGLGADHVTATGERRSVTLRDGSTAHLNSASALSTNFDGGTRAITLHAGEAHFIVAPEPDRPFVVTASNAQVRALGTAFSVRRLDAGVRVVVTESEVALRGLGMTTDLRLRAGMAASWRPGTGVVGPERVDVRAEIAWTRGKLIFNRRPLGEVVAELDRYQFGRLIVVDKALARREVSGVVPLDHAGAGLDLVERSLDARLIRLPLLTLIH